MKSSRRQEAKLRIMARDGTACFYCRGEMNVVDPTSPSAMTIEHLLPRSHQGSNHLWNLVGAGRACNKFAAGLPLVDKIKLRDNWKGPRCGSN